MADALGPKQTPKDEVVEQAGPEAHQPKGTSNVDFCLVISRSEPS